MSDISSIRAKQYKEAENKRHNFELRKLRKKNARIASKETQKNKDHLNQMKSEFERKSENLKNDLERKLISLRNRHARKMTEEKERLDQEVKMLKSSHKDKVAEIKISHRQEIQNLSTSQQKTLEMAHQKFLKEKNKLNAET